MTKLLLTANTVWLHSRQVRIVSMVKKTKLDFFSYKKSIESQFVKAMFPVALQVSEKIDREETESHKR